MFPSLSGAGDWSPEIAVGAGMTGIIPANIKFNLFGTIGSKFKVATGRYRRQQTVFFYTVGYCPWRPSCLPSALAETFPPVIVYG